MAPDTVPLGHSIRVYFQEGERTMDRRIFDINSINFNRPPPLPVRLQLTEPESGGHAGATICGVINKVYRDGHVIIGEGPLDLGSAAGIEAERLIREGFLQTWSPEVGDETVDVEINVTDEDSNTPQDELAHFRVATWLGVSLVALPALSSAVVELLDIFGNVISPAPQRLGPESTDAGESHVPVDPSAPQEIIERIVMTDGDAVTGNQLDAIAACAGPSSPPPSFFTNPRLTELQRFTTISADGRIAGHVAGRDECHVGYLDRCITIDDIAPGFDYAYVGYVVAADGSKVPTSPLPIKGGHAARGLDYQAALAHYDDPSTVAADIVYGYDEFGIWFSGALRPSVTESQVHALRASGVSLDARQIDGKLRYLATCCVNTPGFPKASARLVACGECEDGDLEIVTLVAAGGPPLPTPGYRPTPNSPEEMSRRSAMAEEALKDFDKEVIRKLALQSPLIDSYIDEISASLPPLSDDKTPIR